MKSVCKLFALLFAFLVSFTCVTPVSVHAGGYYIPDGTYMIVSGNSSKRVLDINSSSKENGGNLETFTKYNTLNQRFYLKYVNGYYTIMSICSGKFLHISDEHTEWANVHQWSGDTSDNAKWEVIRAHNGSGYYIRNKSNGAYLTNSNGSTRPGNNVRTSPDIWGNDQRWYFETIEAGHIDRLAGKTWQVMSGNSGRRVLDISGSSQSNGGNLILYYSTCNKNQMFRLYHNTDDNTFSLRVQHSGKYLHIEDESKSYCNVHQWSGRNHPNARWDIIPVGDGYYFLRNVADGCYLDNSGSSTKLGNNVLAYPFHGGNNQKWKFVVYLATVPEE